MSEIKKIRISGVTYDLGGSGGASLDENTEKVISSALNDLDARKADRMFLKNYQPKGDYVDENFVKDELSAYKTIEEDDKDSKVISAALNYLNENSGGGEPTPEPYEPKEYWFRMEEFYPDFEDRCTPLGTLYKDDRWTEEVDVSALNVQDVVHITENNIGEYKTLVTKIGNNIYYLSVIYVTKIGFYFSNKKANSDLLNINSFELSLFHSGYKVDKYRLFPNAYAYNEDGGLGYRGGYLLSNEMCERVKNGATFNFDYDFNRYGPLKTSILYLGRPHIRKNNYLEFRNNVLGSEEQKRNGFDVVPLVRYTAEKDGVIGSLLLDEEYKLTLDRVNYHNEGYEVVSEPIKRSVLDKWLPGWNGFKFFSSFDSFSTNSLNRFTSLFTTFVSDNVDVPDYQDPNRLYRLVFYRIDNTYAYIDLSSSTSKNLRFDIMAYWEDDGGIINSEYLEMETYDEEKGEYLKCFTTLKDTYNLPYSNNINRYKPYSSNSFESIIEGQFITLNASGEGGDIDAYTKQETDSLLNAKQDKMTNNYLSNVEVGGSSISIETKAFKDESIQKTDTINFKTINGNPIFGMGDIKIEGGSVDAYTKAESDDKFALKDDVPTLQTSYIGNNKNYIYSEADSSSLYNVISKFRFISKPQRYELEYNFWGDANSRTGDYYYINGATSEKAGVMTASDKIKLDSMDMDGLKMKKLTQSEYDSLSNKDNNTLYIIV